MENAQNLALRKRSVSRVGSRRVGSSRCLTILAEFAWNSGTAPLARFAGLAGALDCTSALRAVFLIPDADDHPPWSAQAIRSADTHRQLSPSN
jgi:hypothetical protein